MMPPQGTGLIDVHFNEMFGSELFWVAMAAIVPFSVAVGSLLTLSVNAIMKHRSRPEAEWAVEMRGSASVNDPHGREDGIELQGKISNVGDGDAFRIRLEARSCRAGLSYKETQGMSGHAYLPTGSVIGFWVSMDLGKWDTAEVDIVWTEPPTRLGKERRYSLTPREYVDVPGMDTLDEATGKIYQRPIAEVLEKNNGSTSARRKSARQG